MAFYNDLKGKAAVVTGGGKGIGKSIALALADCGAKVAVVARTVEELEAVAETIKSNGGDAVAVQADLMFADQIEAAVKTVQEAFGTIDILVNNAAKSYLRPLMDLRIDGWDKIFNLNCRAPFLLSRAAAELMKENGGGKIVNITTVGAVRGGSGMGAYHASKAALAMLTKCMAVEWAPYHINVNAVGPGLTRTEFSRPLWSNPEVEKLVASKIPMARIGEPEEIVGAVLFLCSESAQYITGESIYVDGGVLANT